MPNAYKAKIEGKERDVTGWTAEGNLLLADGEQFEIWPLDVAPGTLRSSILLQVSKLTFTGGVWLLDGECLNAPRDSTSPFQNSESLTEYFTRMNLRDTLNRRESELRGDDPVRLEQFRHSVVAVAFLSEHYEDFPEQAPNPEGSYKVLVQGEPITMIETKIPSAKAFRPVLLCTFRSIVEEPARDGSLPDCFTSYEDAAAYVGMTDRTLKNWKKRGWLNVEQHGRLIRIARTDLDKCRKKN